MGMYVRATGLALGLAGFLLGGGCGQQDPAKQAGTVVEQKAGERAETARTAAAIPTVEDAEKEDGVRDTEISIKRSGPVAKDAYEKARAKAKD